MLINFLEYYVCENTNYGQNGILIFGLWKKIHYFQIFSKVGQSGESNLKC